MKRAAFKQGLLRRAGGGGGGGRGGRLWAQDGSRSKAQGVRVQGAFEELGSSASGAPSRR